MPSWNETYPSFNDSIIQESVAERKYVTRRVIARASEARRQISTQRYWSEDLSGLLLNSVQLEEIRALEALARGDVFPVLKRIASYCLLESEDGTPAPLGTGMGAPQTFQLKKVTLYQGRSPIVDEISYPWYDYPDLKDLNGMGWEPLPELQIWRGDYRFGGTDITGDCDIDRNTGFVTVTATGALYATGGFLWKFLAPNGMGVTMKGPCLYEVKQGVRLVEPFPGVEELL